MDRTTEELKAAAVEAGADLVGVARLGPFKAEGTLLLPRALERFTNAVSLAVRLDDAILEAIAWAPTPAYAEHYRAVNATLNRLAAEVVGWIAARAFSACAIPASEIVDEGRLLR
jgi:hypothetical protein